MWKYYNPNPKHSRVGDCVVRAICKLTGQSWTDTFCDLALYGLMRCDMPSANAVWGQYLIDKGYKRHFIDDSEYTVRDFAGEHFKGRYLLAISGHVVCSVDGDWFDTWDSGDEIVVYYWQKEE